MELSNPEQERRKQLQKQINQKHGILFNKSTKLNGWKDIDQIHNEKNEVRAIIKKRDVDNKEIYGKYLSEGDFKRANRAMEERDKETEASLKKILER